MRISITCALILFCAVPARAQQGLPRDAAIFRDLVGVRSNAMGGAHRGVGTSNDTLFLNPAGMAAATRYSVELNYAYSPFDELTRMSVSAVDSKSGPVAGAIGYTHDRGDDEGVDPELHRFYMASAYNLSDALALGVSARHIRGELNDGDERRALSLYTADVGLLLRLGSLGIGATAHNVIKTEMNRMTPLTYGLGAAYQASGLVLAGDVTFDSRDESMIHSYHAGVEYFLGGTFPVRIGYRRAPFVDKEGELQNERVATAGAAWVNQSGALAVSFERSLDRARNWGLVTSLQFFL